jgi:hypothetical protein
LVAMVTYSFIDKSDAIVSIIVYLVAMNHWLTCCCNPYSTTRIT